MDLMELIELTLFPQSCVYAYLLPLCETEMLLGQEQNGTSIVYESTED